MVLESIASALLSKYLGEYIEGLDSKDLKLEVTSGNVVLKNLKLKRSALRELELPVEIKEGSLGQLSLKIPWSSLGSQASVVRIEDVFLLLGPRKPADATNADELEERALAQKLGRLQLAEMLGLDQPQKDEPKKDVKANEPAAPGWIQSLVMKVVDNLQVFVERVHIRYEDEGSEESTPFSAGLTLELLHAQSTDPHWQPSFLSVSQALLHKLVTLKNVAVYFNTGKAKGSPLQYRSMEEWQAEMAALIPHGENSAHQYVLKPVSGELKALLDTGPFTAERPRMSFSLSFNAIEFAVDRAQYLRMLALAEMAAEKEVNVKYVRNRPKGGVRPDEDPRAWWAYAIAAVKSDVRDERKQWEWETIKQRRIDRKDYLDLYKKKKKNVTLSPVDSQRLVALERILPYEDILLYRKLANAALHRDEEKAKAEKAQSGWFGGWFRGTQTTPEDDEGAWKELYSAIGYHEPDAKEKAEDSALYPKDYIKIEASVNIKKASAAVHDEAGERPILLEAAINDLGVGLKMREGGMGLRLALGSFTVDDYHTLAPNPTPLPFVAPPPVEEAGGASDPLLLILVDLNPLDSGSTPVDLRLSLKAQPLVVLFSRSIVDRIVRVFAREAPVSSAVTENVTQSVEELRTRTAARLTYMLEQQQKKQIHIDLKAPTVIVPKRFDRTDCPTLVLDLGHLRLEHDSRARSQHVDTVSDSSTTVDLGYFYDSFDMSLSRVTALVSPSRPSFSAVSLGQLGEHSLLSPLDFNVQLDVLTVQAPQLPSLKVKAQLPALKVYATKEKIRDALRVVNAIAKAGSTPQPAPHVRAITTGSSSGQDEPAVPQTSPQMEMEFHLGSFVATVRHTEKNASAHGKPLLRARMERLDVKVTLGADRHKASVVLHAIQLEDRREKAYLFKSAEGADLIKIDYTGTPQTSPLYENVQHEVGCVFGGINVGVHRPTIAAALQWVNQLQSEMPKPKSLPAIEGGEDVKPEAAVEADDEADDNAVISSTPGGSLVLSKPEIEAAPELLARVSLSMTQAGLALYKDGDAFIEGQVRGVTVQCEVQVNGGVRVQLQLEQHFVREVGTLESNEAAKRMWGSIVESEGEHDALKVVFEQRVDPKETEGQMKIEVHVGTVRVTFAQRIVAELQRYFQAFARMQAIFVAAQTKASQSAAKSAQSAMGTRIALDISVHHPTVLVPVHSGRTEHLRIDLGRIRVTNTFLRKQDELVDGMAVKVKKMSISVRSGFEEDATIMPILSDTQVRVTLERPLTANAQKKVPDLSLSLAVPAVEIGICEESLKQMLRVPTENLLEAPSRPDEKELARVEEMLDFDMSHWTPDVQQAGAEKENALAAMDEPAPAATLRFHCEVGKVEMVLAEGHGRKEDEILALSLLSFETRFSRHPKGQRASVGLKAIVLEDRRKNAVNVCRLILTPLDEKSAQIAVSFTEITADKMRELDVTIARTAVVLLPEALADHYKFAMRMQKMALESLAAMNKVEEKIEKVEEKWEKKLEEGLGEDQEKEEKADEDAQTQRAVAEQATEPSEEIEVADGSDIALLVRARIREPQVYALEDVGGSNTRAMMINLGSIDCDFLMRHPQRKTTLSIKACEIARCELDQIEAKTLGEVIRSLPLLQPMDISIVLNEDIGVNRRNLAVQLGEVHTIVSYRDIALAIALYKGTGPLMNAFVGGSVETDPAASEVPTQEVIAAAPPPLYPTSLSIAVSMAALYFSALDDALDPRVVHPVCRLVLAQVEAALSEKEGEREVYATVATMMIDAYNEPLASFEPVLEPWTCEAQITLAPPLTRMHVVAKELLNLNVSHALFALLVDATNLAQRLQALWAGDGGKLGSAVEGSRVTFSPYVLYNETGKHVQWWRVSSQARGKTHELKPGESVNIDAEDVSEEQNEEPKSRIVQTRAFIGVRIEDRAIGPIALDVGGKTAHRITADTCVVSSVVLRAGTKHVSLRGDHLVKNSTNHPLTVRTVLSEDGSHRDFYVDSKANLSLPLDLDFDVIRIKPSKFQDAEWSEFTRDKDDGSRGIFACKLSSGNVWCAVARTEKDLVGDVPDTVMSLSAPLEVENLLPVPIKLALSTKDDKNEKEATGVRPPTIANISAGSVTRLHILPTPEERIISLAVTIPSLSDIASKPVRLPYTPTDPEKPLRWSTIDSQNRELRVLGAVQRDASHVRRVLLYVESWISNLTGLPILFAKQDGKELAGQGKVSEQPLPDGQLEWYDVDLAPKEDAKEEGGLILVGEPVERILYGHRDRLRLRVANSEWSEPFPIGKSNEGQVAFDDKRSQRRYVFAVHVTSAPGRFWRTAIARVLPGTVLVNLAGTPLFVKQASYNESTSLKPDVQLPYHWPSFAAPRSLHVSLDCESWTEPIDVAVAGSFQMRLEQENKNGGKSIFGLHVHVRVNQGTAYVVLGGQERPFYLIDNRSSMRLTIVQKGYKSVTEVRAHEKRPFFLDQAQEAVRAAVVHIGGEPREIPLDVLGRQPSLRGPKNERVRVELTADGPTRMLVLMDKSSQSESESEAEPLIPRTVTLAFSAALRGIGVCVIDATPRSLLYATLQTLDVSYERSDVDERAEVKVGAAQVDNQLATPFPVLMLGRPPADQPFLNLSYVADLRYSTLKYVKYLSLLVQEMDVEVDQVFLLHAVDFSTALLARYTELSGNDREKRLLEGTDERLSLLAPSSLSQSDLYYFELLHLHPLKVNVSFLSVPPEDLSAETAQLQELLAYVSALTDIERAPLRLNALILEHPLASRAELQSQIIAHYTRSALQQSYLIVGSADFLGNPVALLSGVGAGVQDFFYEPAKGLVTSPKDFGLGVLRGTSSLATKSAAAVLSSASKITGTVAKVGALATFDEDYQRARARMRQQKAKHVGAGLALGIREFGVGVYQGVTGIVTQPIEGAQREGALGLLKGVGKGVAGAVFKPMVGAVDFVTRTAEGLKNTADDGGGPKVRIRPPRHFGSDRVLRVYRFRRALGQALLHAADQGAFRSQVYVAHAPVEEERVIVLSERLLVLLRPSVFQLDGAWTAEWEMPLASIAKPMLETGQKLVLMRFKPEPTVTVQLDCSALRARKFHGRLVRTVNAVHASLPLVKAAKQSKQLEARGNPRYSKAMGLLVNEEGSSEEDDAAHIIAKRARANANAKRSGNKRGDEEREGNLDDERAPLLDGHKRKQKGCSPCCTDACTIL